MRGRRVVLVLGMLATVVVTLVAGVALWAGGAWLLGLFGAGALSQYVLVISLSQLGGGFANALTSWAVRTKSFSQIAAARLVQAAGQARIWPHRRVEARERLLDRVHVLVEHLMAPWPLGPLRVLWK